MQYESLEPFKLVKTAHGRMPPQARLTCTSLRMPARAPEPCDDKNPSATTSIESRAEAPVLAGDSIRFRSRESTARVAEDIRRRSGGHQEISRAGRGEGEREGQDSRCGSIRHRFTLSGKV